MSKNLEKMATQNIIQSIEKIVENSFLILMFDALTMTFHPSLKDALQEYELKSIYDFYAGLLLKLEHVLDGPESIREQHFRDCFTHKSTLINIYNVVKTYLSVCNITDLYITDITAKGGDDDSCEFLQSKKLLKTNVSKFMDKAISLDVEGQAAAIILTVLPNYFDDAELIDYVLKSVDFNLKFVPKSEALSHINQIIRGFAPNKSPEYGRYFKKCGESLLDIFESIRLSTFDEKKISSEYEDLCLEVEDMLEIITYLYSSLSFLSILLSSMYSFRNITSTNSQYKQFYSETVRTLKSSPTDDKTSEEIIHSVKVTIEKEMAALGELAKRKHIIFKNTDIEAFSDKAKALFSAEFYHSSIFYESLEEITDELSDITFNDEIAPPGVAKKELKSLELTIKESLLGMSDELKSASKKNLFLTVGLTSFFNKADILNYIEKLFKIPIKRDELDDAHDALDALIEDDILSKLVML